MDSADKIAVQHRFKLIWEDIEDKAPLFRFTMACIFVLLGAGLNIHIFKKYEINYFHIFALDYRF